MAIRLFNTVTPGKRRKNREGEPGGPSLGIRDPRAAGYGFSVPSQSPADGGNGPADGDPAGGNTADGDPAGGDPAGGNTAGGNTAGGNTAGGNDPAGNSPANGSGTNTASSFDDYYNRLISTLRSYGINMELPTLEELYAQLSAFLRPSVDDAIEDRRSYGETVLAELDADAYSRGMGGSSYLSSMKNREYDAAARDIAAMESKYSATLAQYIYNASNELARIQAEFEQIRRQHEYELQRQREQQRHELELQRRREQQELEMQRRREQQALRLQQLRSGSSGGTGAGTGSGTGSGTSGSGEDGGLTEEEYRSNFNFYSVYMRGISAEERAKVFSGSGAHWRQVREEMLADLTPEDYELLRRTYDPNYRSGHGASASGNSGRPLTWTDPERMID